MLAWSGDVSYFDICEILLAESHRISSVGQLMYWNKFLYYSKVCLERILRRQDQMVVYGLMYKQSESSYAIICLKKFIIKV